MTTPAPAPAIPRTRLAVTEALSRDALITLDPERSHYLRHVLRLGVGEGVRLFNQRDGEWRGELAGTAKSGCSVRVGENLRPPAPEAELTLLFAPLKRTAIDLVVQKATELGVSCLQPVLTRYTDVARVNLERLAAIALEAAEQCERLSVPTVAEPRPLAAVLAEWPPEMPLLAAVEAGPAQPIAEAAARYRGRPAGLLIGPEGGFEPAELVDLASRSFLVTVGLGPRILKAETAALAALACWQALAGDWVGESAGEVRPPLRG